MLKNVEKIENDIFGSSPTVEKWKEANPDFPKHVLCVTLDGTLREFKADSEYDRGNRGFYEGLRPMPDMLETIKTIKKENPDIKVVISTLLSDDAPTAQKETDAWLDKYLPEVEKKDRIYTPVKEAVKSHGIEQAVCDRFGGKDIDSPEMENVTFMSSVSAFLDGVHKGKCIEVLNEINHTGEKDKFISIDGSEKSISGVAYDTAPDIQAKRIVSVITKGDYVRDVPPAFESRVASYERVLKENNLAIEASKLDSMKSADAVEKYAQELLAEPMIRTMCRAMGEDHNRYIYDSNGSKLDKEHMNKMMCKIAYTYAHYLDNLKGYDPDAYNENVKTFRNTKYLVLAVKTLDYMKRMTEIKERHDKDLVRLSDHKRSQGGIR